VLQKAELSDKADSENYLGGSSETMYFIGLDVHKKTTFPTKGKTKTGSFDAQAARSCS
jgi:hypothetical protein